MYTIISFLKIVLVHESVLAGAMKERDLKRKTILD
jgi:hypothetical protein